jgi:hypothetical protein
LRLKRANTRVSYFFPERITHPLIISYHHAPHVFPEPHQVLFFLLMGKKFLHSKVVSTFVAGAATFHQSIPVSEDFGRSRARGSSTIYSSPTLWQLQPRASRDGEGVRSVRAVKRANARTESFMLRVWFENGSTLFWSEMQPAGFKEEDGLIVQNRVSLPRRVLSPYI